MSVLEKVYKIKAKSQAATDIKHIYKYIVSKSKKVEIVI